MPQAKLTFVARQPILNAKGDVYAYELLHRSGPDGEFTGTESNQATIEVLRTALLSGPLKRLTGGQLAFINVPEELLVRDFLSIMPTETTVIEVLETVKPTPRVVAALRALKANGHKIAINDFEGKDTFEPLVALADYIKVDFQQVRPGQRAEVVKRWGRQGLTFIAQKVESTLDQEEALEAGYELFQGYYYFKPELTQYKEIPRNRASYVQLMHALFEEEPNLEEVGSIITRDMSLTAGLLRYMNSTAYGTSEEIASIRQALVHLGQRQLKRWGTLLALTGLGTDKPDELVRTSLIRGRFGELIAEHLGREERTLEAFLAGLFSTLDALLDMTLKEAVDELSLTESMTNAILGDNSIGGLSTQLARAIEIGDWAMSAMFSKELGIQSQMAHDIYLEAILWGDNSLDTTDPEAEAA
ncbi:MAG: c-di-GMP-related signal transduction protein [Planctomycetota bacterium]|jgi:c-di-GMP-related signal transduction protein